MCGEPSGNLDRWRCPACGAEARTADGFPLLAPAARRPRRIRAVGVRPAGRARGAALLVPGPKRPDLRTHPSARAGRDKHARGRMRNRLRAARACHETFPTMRLAGGEPSLAGLVVARQRVPGAQLLQLDARASALRRRVGCRRCLRRARAPRRRRHGAGRARARRRAPAASFCSPCRSTPGCGARTTSTAAIGAATAAAELVARGARGRARGRARHLLGLALLPLHGALAPPAPPRLVRSCARAAPGTASPRSVLEAALGAERR